MSPFPVKREHQILIEMSQHEQKHWRHFLNRFLNLYLLEKALGQILNSAAMSPSHTIINLIAMGTSSFFINPGIALVLAQEQDSKENK